MQLTNSDLHAANDINIRYQCHYIALRLPEDIISHAVVYYMPLSLSLRHNLCG